MKKLIVFGLLLGAASTGWARPPIFVPRTSESVAYQATNASLQPTPADTPPAPSIDQPIGRQPMGTYVVPGEYPLTPISQVEPGMIIGDATGGGGIPLYQAVMVKDERNIAPCAVQKIVTVPDPCNPCCCVAVCICVPPCACEEVSCSRYGKRTTFDYGKYAVKVTARGGTLVVNYDD